MVHVTGRLYDLRRSRTGMNGIHIHELGDLSNGCESAGPHFNPTQSDHGAQTDTERHVGDLGNIVIDPTGTGTVDVWDNQIALQGQYSILGRSIVVSLLPQNILRMLRIFLKFSEYSRFLPNFHPILPQSLDPCK